jgi:hypothetical protein
LGAKQSQVQTQWFFHHDVLAGGRGVQGDLTMPVIGNAHRHQVDFRHG